MLDTTNEIAKRYRIKFGSEKSQILTINEKRGHTETKMGDQVLDQTETYKYLGISINNTLVTWKTIENQRKNGSSHTDNLLPGRQ